MKRPTASQWRWMAGVFTLVLLYWLLPVLPGRVVDFRAGLAYGRSLPFPDRNQYTMGAGGLTVTNAVGSCTQTSARPPTPLEQTGSPYVGLGSLLEVRTYRVLGPGERTWGDYGDGLSFDCRGPDGNEITLLENVEPLGGGYWIVRVVAAVVTFAVPIGFLVWVAIVGSYWYRSVLRLADRKQKPL